MLRTLLEAFVFPLLILQLFGNLRTVVPEFLCLLPQVLNLHGWRQLRRGLCLRAGGTACGRRTR